MEAVACAPKSTLYSSSP